MDVVLHNWPIILTAAGVIIWAVRVESRMGLLATAERMTKAEGRIETLDRTTVTVERMAESEGQIANVAQRMQDLQAMAIRIDSKIDAVLTTATAALTIAQDRVRHEHAR